MKREDVSAKIGADGTPVTIKANFAENLGELVDQFEKPDEEGSGEKLIFQHGKASIVVALQGKMRALMDPEREGGPMNAEQIQNELVDADGNLKWRPGNRTPGKSPAEKIAEMAEKLDPDLRAQLLAALGTKAQSGGNGNGDKAAAETRSPTGAKQPTGKQAQPQRGGGGGGSRR